MREGWSSVATAKPKVVESASVESVGTDVVVTFNDTPFAFDGQAFIAFLAEARVVATGVIR
jgi:hypothetical protein